MLTRDKNINGPKFADPRVAAVIPYFKGLCYKYLEYRSSTINIGIGQFDHTIIGLKYIIIIII